jgi:bifunctional non-homologous end joining protein LigD
VADKLTIKAGRRRVEVSNPDKVLYPKAGFTKADVAGYYRAIAPVMLRHLKDRPVTLVRFPDGVDGASFFQKACPEHRPDWVATATLHSSARKRDLVYCVLNEQAAIVWAANLASLELHVLLARRRALDRPDFVVFDLDPGPPADVLACCEVALALRPLRSGRARLLHQDVGLQGIAALRPGGARDLRRHQTVRPRDR